MPRPLSSGGGLASQDCVENARRSRGAFLRHRGVLVSTAAPLDDVADLDDAEDRGRITLESRSRFSQTATARTTAIDWRRAARVRLRIEPMGDLMFDSGLGPPLSTLR